MSIAEIFWMVVEFLVVQLKILHIVFFLGFILQVLPIMIWLERKASAYIQDRPGPQRAAIGPVRMGGFIHNIADVLKLLFKEDIVPTNAYRPFYIVAPMIPMAVALLTYVVVPFGDYISVNGQRYDLIVADVDTGLLFFLAIGSMGVYGVMLAGWASNSKYSLLGGLRSTAQLISYEISMGLAAVTVFLIYDSVRLSDIVHRQTANPLGWGAFSGPGLLAFILFTTATFAETNRNPFDLPEGESELVAGFHTEYSSFKFALFFMAEYANMVVAGTVIATLFFGGWQIPFLSTEWLVSNTGTASKLFLGAAPLTAYWAYGNFKDMGQKRWGDMRDLEPTIWAVVFSGVTLLTVALAFAPWGFNDTTATVMAFLLQFGAFTAKTMFFAFFFIWVRWTLPRFRYDQLMRLGWNYMLPISIGNLVFAGVWVLAFPNGVLGLLNIG